MTRFAKSLFGIIITVISIGILAQPEPLLSNRSKKTTYLTIPLAQYHDQMKGFWLGQLIANWTGLVTEMDKIGGE